MGGHERPCELFQALGLRGMDFMTDCLTMGVRVLLETESFYML